MAGGGVSVSDETVKKVKDSWDIVLQIPDCTMVAAELLFRNIFKYAPGAIKMFPFGKDYDQVCDRMFKSRLFKKHGKLVVGMLNNAVQLLDQDLNTLEEVLVELGAKHVGYGILPEHYPVVGTALLDTLGTALGDDNFTDDLKQSWAGVYGFITTSMLKGANESLLRLSVPVYSADHGKERRRRKSATNITDSITLDQYVSSMLPGQTELYYITMSGDDGGIRGMDLLQQAKELQQAGVVILQIHKNKQSVLAKNLQQYLGRKMIDVSTQQVDKSWLPKPKKKTSSRRNRNKKNNSHQADDDDKPPPISSIAIYKDEGLNDTEATEFCTWFQSIVGKDHVEICTPTCNFASQAAKLSEVIAEEDQEKERHLEDFRTQLKAKKHVEINPSHPLIIEINKARTSGDHPIVAKMLAEQIYDNCLTQAGMLQDYRIMVNRINDLSMMLLQEKRKNQQAHHNARDGESTADSTTEDDEEGDDGEGGENTAVNPAATYPTSEQEEEKKEGESSVAGEEEQADDDDCDDEGSNYSGSGSGSEASVSVTLSGPLDLLDDGDGSFDSGSGDPDVTDGAGSYDSEAFNLAELSD